MSVPYTARRRDTEYQIKTKTRHTARMLTVAEASAVHGDSDAVPNLRASITYRAGGAMCEVTTFAFLICFRCDCAMRLEAIAAACDVSDLRASAQYLSVQLNEHLVALHNRAQGHCGSLPP